MVRGVLVALVLVANLAPAAANVGREPPIVMAPGVTAASHPAAPAASVVLPIAVPGGLRDPAIAERAARTVLGGDLALAANRVDGAVRTVAFHQTWHGLRVVGGQAYAVFAHDRLFAIGGTLRPGVTAALAPSTHRIDLARAWLAADTGLAIDVRATGERVVLPVGGGYVVADWLAATARGAPGAWDVYVAADGSPLERVSRLTWATGTLAFDVGVRYPTGARHDAAAPRVAITVDGSAATTGDDGTFTWPGSAAATVIAGVTGSAVHVINTTGPQAAIALTVAPGGTGRWSLATDEHGDAQLTTYIAASLAKERGKRVAPELSGFLDQPLDFFVNENDACDAFSTGDAVHLFGANATCENTGRLTDVVAHEVGHIVHFHAVIPGAGMYAADLTEGLADFFAANLTEDSGVGRGLYYTSDPARDIDPAGREATWPGDRAADPHVTGLIVSGALWDLRALLIAQLGHDPGVAATEHLLDGIMQHAFDLPSAYTAALIADDDDGDLANGTPHRCAIREAFGRHGLADAGYVPTTVSLPRISPLFYGATDLAVDVNVPPDDPCAHRKVTGIAVAWQAGDVADTVALAPSGATWLGQIPAQPVATIVRYRITATLDDGATIAYPDNPADPWYATLIGPATQIWCERFDSDPGWTQSGSRRDWEVAAPRANTANDPEVPFTGVHVLGTQVTGDGRYPASASSAIATPAIDATAYDAVYLTYHRWLGVEDAAFDQASVAIGTTPIWSNATGPTRHLDHIDREWRLAVHDVTPYARAPLVATWSLVSDASRQFGGWNLDDVCFVGIGGPPPCGDCDVHHDGGCTAGGGDGNAPWLLGILAVGLARKRRSAYPLNHHRC